MDWTAFIDVAIGLSLIYLGISLYVTIVNEFIAQALSRRGKQLAKDLKTLIDNDTLKEKLAKAPALKPFLEVDGKPGSFVDTKILSQLLVGALGDGKAEGATMKELIASIETLPDSALKTQLAALAQSASESVDKFVASVSQWADSSLTTLGEIYKKKTQVLSFIVGLIAAVLFNLDTLTIVDHLYHDKQARDALVVVAETFTAQTQKDALDKCTKLEKKEREADDACKPITGLVEAIQGGNKTLGVLPIGWKDWAEVCDLFKADKVASLFKHIIGWLVTALAVSLGAPFWFDLLNRLINVRHGMRRPQPEAAKS